MAGCGRSLISCSSVILLSCPLYGQVLAAGTQIEARLSTATGSRISRIGDRVEAVVIAAVSFQGQIVIPQRLRLIGLSSAFWPHSSRPTDWF